MSRTLRRVLPVLLAAVVVLGACASGDDGADLSNDPELQQGREVYVANCARCHGPNGEGGVGNKLNDGLVEQRFPDIEDHIALIRNGVGSMPAWEGTLTPEEIRAVARYEREVL